MSTAKQPSQQGIDLRRLPAPWRYVVALLVIAPIVWLAWHVGKDKPHPAWLERWLFPILAWIYIALAVRWVVLKLVRRRK